MRMILIAAAAATLSLAPLVPASAFVPNQSHVVTATAALADVVTVRHHRHYKHHYKHRPRGWSRGKAWWKRGGHGVPPGHRR
jgi:hypothetical protein